MIVSGFYYADNILYCWLDVGLHGKEKEIGDQTKNANIFTEQEKSNIDNQFQCF